MASEPTIIGQDIPDWGVKEAGTEQAVCNGGPHAQLGMGESRHCRRARLALVGPNSYKGGIAKSQKKQIQALRN